MTFQETLKIAREDWAWCAPRPEETFCGDNLIALAVDCQRQTRNSTAPLTAEDAAILRAQSGAVIDSIGNYRGFQKSTAVLYHISNLNR